VTAEKVKCPLGQQRKRRIWGFWEEIDAYDDRRLIMWLTISTPALISRRSVSSRLVSIYRTKRERINRSMAGTFSLTGDSAGEKARHEAVVLSFCRLDVGRLCLQNERNLTDYIKYFKCRRFFSFTKKDLMRHAD
jgi:hypothetical protein